MFTVWYSECISDGLAQQFVICHTAKLLGSCYVKSFPSRQAGGFAVGSRLEWVRGWRLSEAGLMHPHANCKGACGCWHLHGLCLGVGSLRVKVNLPVLACRGMLSAT